MPVYVFDMFWVIIQVDWLNCFVDRYSQLPDPSLVSPSCVVKHYASTDASKSVVQLLHCIKEVDKWMSSNRLRLNAEKTQYIWLGSPQILAKINKIPLRVDGVKCVPT